MLGARANGALIAAFNKQNGFDDPWLVQYLRYIGNLLRGNLGYSYKLNQSVTALISEVWARSAWLSGISLVLSVVIAIPLGIYQAVRRNTIGDYAADEPRLQRVRHAGLLPRPDPHPDLRPRPALASASREASPTRCSASSGTGTA